MNFNAWSQERIKRGTKRLTSRRESHADDPDVLYVVGPLPWKFVREFLWRDEGAVSPAELQKVIEDIFHRPVKDDEMFHVHVLKPREAKSA